MTSPLLSARFDRYPGFDELTGGVVQPLVARITLADGAALASGADRLELGQLTGRALKNTAIHQFGSSDDTTDRAVAEWIVEAPPGTTVDVEVRQQRAGVVTTTVTLA